MTFLQLCQRLRLEAEIPGSGPAAVTGQTGQLAQIVTWINQANQDVQNLNSHWKFMWATASKTLAASKRDYDISADFSIDDLERFHRKSFFAYKTTDGVAYEYPLTFEEYDTWLEVYSAGYLAAAEGPPQKIIRLPNGTLRVDPVPDVEYTVRFDYYRTAQDMTANDDESYIPTAFQPIIVWRALEMYADTNDARELLRKAQKGYKLLLGGLRRRYLPMIRDAEPLA